MNYTEPIYSPQPLTIGGYQVEILELKPGIDGKFRWRYSVIKDRTRYLGYLNVKSPLDINLKEEILKDIRLYNE